MLEDANPLVPRSAPAAKETMQIHEETAWLEQLSSAQLGDSQAAGELINQVRDYLLLVANRELDGSLRAKVGASDLVQQTMLEAGRDLQRFRGHTAAELTGWMVRILRHNLTDVARQYRSTRCREIGREVSSSAVLELPLANKQRTASSICRRVEADEQLDRAVSRLPEHYRKVIQLRHIQDLSWSEVAMKLGISAEAGRKLWARTLAKLREELGKEHESSS